MRIVHVAANAQNAAALHGFETVLNHVVKSLLHLTAINLEQRQVGAEFLFDHNVAVPNFGREKTDRLLDNRIYVFRMQLRPRGPDCAQELRDDRIEPIDLGARNVDRFLKFFLRIVIELANFALHQLQMDMKRVERIANLVRHAGR